MKILLALALFLASSHSQAATPWESLTQKTLLEGTRLESNFGASKFLVRQEGALTAYFTIEIDPESGKPKRYSAVIENGTSAVDGKRLVEQDLFWFTPLGELAVKAHYRITFRADGSLESRQEIAYGQSPDAADLARWDALLADWAREL